MGTLDKLQQEFSDYLFFGSENIVDRVVNDDRVGNRERLEIYRNAYDIRLKKCIETDHPVLSRYLGDELFDRLAIGYRKAYPSTFSSLRYYCDNLPDYLQQEEPFKSVPILAEIAAFERLLMFAFDAPDVEGISIDDLRLISPESWPTLRFEFHPSVVLFECQWNGVEIWQALKHNDHPPEADKQQETSWLIWRNRDRLTQFGSLQIDGLMMFNGLQSGKAFAAICEDLIECVAENEISACAARYLNRWIDAGLVVSIKEDSRV